MWAKLHPRENLCQGERDHLSFWYVIECCAIAARGSEQSGLLHRRVVGAAAGLSDPLSHNPLFCLRPFSSRPCGVPYIP